MNKEDNCMSLIKAGFTEKQVEHLNRFRSKQIEKEQSRVVAEQRRLEFARWLVTNGRLNERVA